MRVDIAQYLNPTIRTVSIRNKESSIILYDGMPVVFADGNTADYLGVDALSYVTSSKRTLTVGLAKTQKSSGILAGEVGEAIVYGFTYAQVALSVRTSSTVATVASAADITAGDVLIPSTKGDGGYLGVGATTDPLRFIAAESLAGLSDNPHTVSNSPTTDLSVDKKAVIKRMKVFVRPLQ